MNEQKILERVEELCIKWNKAEGRDGEQLPYLGAEDFLEWVERNIYVDTSTEKS